MALIISPGMTKNEMENVNAGVSALQKDIDRSLLDDVSKGAWADFVREWLAFRDDNQGWLNRGYSGVYEQVIDFKRRLQAWREKFIAHGGDVSSVASTVPQPYSWVSILAGATVALAGIWVLFGRSSERG